MKFVKTMIVLFFTFSSLVIFANDKAYANQIDDKTGIPILLYHHMLHKKENKNFKSSSAVISVEAFEEQMKYLYEKGYYTATLDELISYMRGEINLPTKTVVITFDDGHKTNYIYAYPILKRYGFKAANFLITSRISDSPVPFNPNGLQFLSWPEINEMKDVFDFGGHTHDLHHNAGGGHPALVSVEENKIVEDLQTSRSLVPTEYFAYPFGTYNKDTIEQLKVVGYQYAFTTDEKNASRNTGVYEIGRKGVYPNTSLSKFKNLINREYFKKGWSKIGDQWYFVKEGQSLQKGWMKTSNKWYYFDQNGLMKTGWIKDQNKWYYLNNSGAMAAGWVKDGSIWYYLDSSGAMRTGWLKQGNAWYYLDSSGAMRTGWYKDANKWYYLAGNGAMRTGWLFAGGQWYYLNASGAMETSWRIVNGTWYYFYNDGRMVSNTSIGGYQIDANGAWIK
ncbi:hypothetical protein E1I69_11405 [Bacillus timonensis]|uniref:NodB homology domain-containing protein n=1 Tax=Bacillus timonensis TaxID=1033734 RepID=A0A4S3PTU5_9BACI|nr:polysaccharide deacetylase family protein [Bacillus timonensis]THE12302.1 hypothetical protein E1I69_11405 [Bacillus timonensis]